MNNKLKLNYKQNNNSVIYEEKSSQLDNSSYQGEPNQPPNMDNYYLGFSP